VCESHLLPPPLLLPSSSARRPAWKEQRGPRAVSSDFFGSGFL
jgi:hypothetical protein